MMTAFLVIMALFTLPFTFIGLLVVAALLWWMVR
jgi:hypothetical protein